MFVSGLVPKLRHVSGGLQLSTSCLLKAITDIMLTEDPLGA